VRRNLARDVELFVAVLLLFSFILVPLFWLIEQIEKIKRRERRGRASDDEFFTSPDPGPFSSSARTRNDERQAPEEPAPAPPPFGSMAWGCGVLSPPRRGRA
jgi:hypothetical protein